MYIYTKYENENGLITYTGWELIYLLITGTCERNVCTIYATFRGKKRFKAEHPRAIRDFHPFHAINDYLPAQPGSCSFEMLSSTQSSSDTCSPESGFLDMNVCDQKKKKYAYTGMEQFWDVRKMNAD